MGDIILIRMMFSTPFLLIVEITVDICVLSNSQHYDIISSGLVNPFKPDFSLSSSSTTSRELLSQFSACMDEDDLMWFKN